VAELTHQMETLLDKLRRHELAPTPEMVDALLAAGDALKAQLARHQAGGAGRRIDTAALLATIRIAGRRRQRRAAPPTAAATAARSRGLVRASAAGASSSSRSAR
jgi:two-component system chemotaxis sensor kinase CheA